MSRGTASDDEDIQKLSVWLEVEGEKRSLGTWVTQRGCKMFPFIKSD